MRDYGKVHTSYWTSSSVRTMTEDGRTLAMYLLTCPHGTIAGVFRLPDGYACEDLQWDSERVKKGFAELLNNCFANRCETTKWVWINKHFDWNPPENPNQKKAAAKIAAQVPCNCCWKQDFMRDCGGFFCLDSQQENNRSETLSKPFPNQEQEQDSKPTNANALVVAGNPAPNCPHQKIIDLYGKHLPELPYPKIWEGQRQQNLAARWRWLLTAKKPGGERYATDAESALGFFLTGRDNKWQGCDLGWLVKSENFAKVISGNYENKDAA